MTPEQKKSLSNKADEFILLSLQGLNLWKQDKKQRQEMYNGDNYYFETINLADEMIEFETRSLEFWKQFKAKL